MVSVRGWRREDGSTRLLLLIYATAKPSIGKAGIAGFGPLARLGRITLFRFPFTTIFNDIISLQKSAINNGSYYCQGEEWPRSCTYTETYWKVISEVTRHV